jgi:hypothetical protein
MASWLVIFNFKLLVNHNKSAVASFSLFLLSCGAFMSTNRTWFFVFICQNKWITILACDVAAVVLGIGHHGGSWNTRHKIVLIKTDCNLSHNYRLYSRERNNSCNIVKHNWYEQQECEKESRRSWSFRAVHKEAEVRKLKGLRIAGVLYIVAHASALTCRKL